MTPRKVWLAIKTPLTMLLLLAFVVVVGAWGYQQTVTPIPKPPPNPCVVQNVGPTFTAKNAYVRLLNGTSTSGLSKNTKLVFGNAGFHVVKAGNFEGSVDKTYIAGADAASPEVLLVRSYFPASTPFQADPVAYRDHVVDIVLGKDFTVKMLSAKPLTSVPLKDGKACITQDYNNVNAES